MENLEIYDLQCPWEAQVMTQILEVEYLKNVVKYQDDVIRGQL